MQSLKVGIRAHFRYCETTFFAKNDNVLGEGTIFGYVSRLGVTFGNVLVRTLGFSIVSGYEHMEWCGKNHSRHCETSFF